MMEGQPPHTSEIVEAIFGEIEEKKEGAWRSEVARWRFG